MPTILLGFCNFTSTTEDILATMVWDGKNIQPKFHSDSYQYFNTEIELSELGATWHQSKMRSFSKSDK